MRLVETFWYCLGPGRTATVRLPADVAPAEISRLLAHVAIDADDEPTRDRAAETPTEIAANADVSHPTRKEE